MRRTTALLSAIMITSAGALAGVTTPAWAADPQVELYVATAGDDDASCVEIESPCATITGGIARALEAITTGAVDATVHIAGGTYNENVTIPAIADGHTLSLIGAGASATTIDGVGDAGAPASVVTVTSGVVGIEGLTITGGYALNGGGISNATATLTIAEVAVTGNTATEGGSYSGGGGIHNNGGTLTIRDSVVSSNRSSGSGNGGGIVGVAGGSVIISDSTVSSNSAAWYVGGILSRDASLTITRSTVSGNTTEKNYGGGIANYDGTLTLIDSTLSGNSATGSGSTVKGGGLYNRGTATITNSTLYGNTATAKGGGIHSQGNASTLVVTSSTIAGNSAASGPGLGRDGGAMTFSRSIISTSGCPLVNVIVDAGYNVTDSCAFQVPNATSISGSATIGLQPLAANGSTGPQTMAIGASSSAHLLVPGCTGTDARGMPRPGLGGTANCDAGAYELQAVAPVVTADPQPQSVVIGSDATFAAAASGVPAPTVQWQVDRGSGFGDIPGATSASLSVTGVTHAMSGYQYRAVFTNGTTDATTTGATLTVPVGALDHLVLSPATTTIDAGQSQAFTAYGYDAHNNYIGDMTADTVFTGSDLTCTDATCTTNVPGTHTVTGTNATATGTATLAVVAVAPAVTTNPQSQTVAIGSDATFTAAASGIPAPTIKWQVDSGAGWLNISGATSTTLSVAGVTHAMSGYQYRAVFTNGTTDATTTGATLTVPVGALDHLVLSPATATFAAGGSQVFTAEGFDAYGNSLGDRTADTAFTGSPDLSCTDATCTSSLPGNYTVTGTSGTATGTATITVEPVAPVVTTNPQPQTVPIGSDATFTAAASGIPAPTITWQVDRGLGFTTISGAASTTLSITGVTHTMSGYQYRAVFTNGTTDATTMAATLTVPVGALDHLVLSPAAATFTAGDEQAFTAEGFDAYGNTLGDLTVDTAFTGSADLSCTDATCTTNVPGNYTVTGTIGTATGTATLTVEALPAVPLPATKPIASGPLTGIPATLEPGDSFTVTATGFAPHAPVTFGIYSTPVMLGTAVTNSSGTAVAHLQIPAGLTGQHTVVASGIGPSLTAMYLEQSVVIEARLPTTGTDGSALSWIGAAGLLLLVLGTLTFVAVSRRRA